MKQRIGIYGSYGGWNLGDEAILEVIIQELRLALDADLVVFSARPDDTRQRHHVHAVPISEIHKDELIDELKRLDALILGGGGIFFEGMADDFLRTAAWAKQQGVPVFIFAVSAGPVSSPETKKLLVETVNAVDMITVRDAEAKKLLHDLGVEQEIHVTADPAFLLKPAEFTVDMLEKQGIKLSENHPLIGFSVREPGQAAPELETEGYHEILANAADFMVERFNAQIIFIPMERHEHKDFQHSHGVIAKMSNAQSAQVLKDEFSPAQIMGLLKHMDFAVGMRLHFLIFAAVQEVAFVPLPYASKVSGLLNALGLPMPPLKEINSGKLCAFLDRFWDHRGEIRQSLAEKIPALKADSAKTFNILFDFLKARQKIQR